MVCGVVEGDARLDGRRCTACGIRHILTFGLMLILVPGPERANRKPFPAPWRPLPATVRNWRIVQAFDPCRLARQMKQFGG
jgi:hypothetical protein